MELNVLQYISSRNINNRSCSCYRQAFV